MEVNREESENKTEATTLIFLTFDQNDNGIDEDPEEEDRNRENWANLFASSSDEEEISLSNRNDTNLRKNCLKDEEQLDVIKIATSPKGKNLNIENSLNIKGVQNTFKGYKPLYKKKENKLLNGIFYTASNKIDKLGKWEVLSFQDSPSAKQIPLPKYIFTGYNFCIEERYSPTSKINWVLIDGTTLSSVILKCGGTVVKDLSQCQSENSIFLGNRFSSIQFPYSIAAKIPCVTAKWVVDCVLKGWFISEMEPYKIPSSKHQENKLNPFFGKCICLDKEDTPDIIIKMLEKSGAFLVDNPDNNVDFVLAMNRKCGLGYYGIELSVPVKMWFFFTHSIVTGGFVAGKRYCFENYINQKFIKNHQIGETCSCDENEEDSSCKMKPQLPFSGALETNKSVNDNTANIRKTNQNDVKQRKKKNNLDVKGSLKNYKAKGHKIKLRCVAEGEWRIVSHNL